MSSELARFQDGFAQALLALDDDLPADFRALAEQPGFAVYRNTVLKGCVDALQANYPAIVRLVGEDWFRAAAALHARARPPGDARLLLYGSDFPEFLRGFPPAADLPYLHGVAVLDRFWLDAHVAADAPALAPAALAGLPPAQLGGMVLVPHPAARWAWFADLPVYTLWSRNRDTGTGTAADRKGGDDGLVWTGEGALLTRPAGAVSWTALDAAGCAFLDACAAGSPLAQAAGAALARDAGTDLAQLMAGLLDAGAFCSMAPCLISPFPQEPA